MQFHGCSSSLRGRILAELNQEKGRLHHPNFKEMKMRIEDLEAAQSWVGCACADRSVFGRMLGVATAFQKPEARIG
jgi:hypothetical protein